MYALSIVVPRIGELECGFGHKIVVKMEQPSNCENILESSTKCRLVTPDANGLLVQPIAHSGTSKKVPSSNPVNSCQPSANEFDLGGCQQPLIMLGLLVVLKIKLEKNMI